MAILVTGGAGFIGSHTCDALLKKNERVICLDNFNDYYPPEKKRKNIERNLASKNFILAETDITDRKSLEKVFGENKDISAIVHLAARAAARPSLDNPLLYAEVNILGTINLLELARKHGVKTFIFSSSSSVYGANKKMPFSEADITESQESPYAITKKTGEMLCKFYSETYGLNITCLRFFTVYGPRGRPDMAPYLFTKWINEGSVVKKFGNGEIHLQLDFKKNDGKIVSAIGFFMAKNGGLDLKIGQTIDLAASIEKSNFRAKPEIRLRIVDVKIKR